MNHHPETIFALTIRNKNLTVALQKKAALLVSPMRLTSGPVKFTFLPEHGIFGCLHLCISIKGVLGSYLRVLGEDTTKNQPEISTSTEFYLGWWVFSTKPERRPIVWMVAVFHQVAKTTRLIVHPFTCSMARGDSKWLTNIQWSMICAQIFLTFFDHG